MPSAKHHAKTAAGPARPWFRRLPPGFWVGVLIGLALAARLAWLAYTRFTEEDAFITFRYARQLVSGNGFVYNPGERLDGTTTPLFTLLLAGWALIVPDILLGAKILNLACALGALLFVWQTLDLLGRSRAEQVGAILLLGLSSKLWLMETEGMEIPLALLLMAASWYALARGRFVPAGILLGLLIWTRVDLFLWPVVLATAAARSGARPALRTAAAAVVSYAPWFVFAAFYFGSPLPHTITAKWVAYAQFDRTPLTEHLLAVFRYLSPFDVPAAAGLNTLLVSITLALGAYGSVRTIRERRLVLLPGFVLLEAARLALTQATFTNRYLVPALWALLILAGLAAGGLWDRVRQSGPAIRWGYAGLLALTLLVGLGYGLRRAEHARLLQIYRHERSLMAIGLWLRDATPAGTRVELEPLGYIGYYSDRVMLDEVGLVTPAVVELNRRQVGAGFLFSYLDPDALVLHCDDALRFQGLLGGEDTGLAERYSPVKQFNPLDFDPYHPNPPETYPGLARGACYEVWQKK